MSDCCIIGGGVVGLAIARELAGRGLAVRLLARDAGRDTASWAAAGILPPAPAHPGMTANEAFTAWSDALIAELAGNLEAETGIDVGLRATGGVHVATSAAAVMRLRADAETWRRRGGRCEWLEPAALAACEPALAGAVARGGICGGYLLADERQIRPSRLLAALERSCRMRGVEITPATATAIDVAAGRVTGIAAAAGGRSEHIAAATYVLAAGAWTERLAAGLGLRVETRPIRGQIVLLRPPRLALRRILNRGLEYLVPRDDGRLLVGSTLEDAGFDATTTAVAVERLRGVARTLLGDAADGPIERAWAGLRPGSVDGLPTIGRVPGMDNAFVAAGHFRAGIHQSAGTAMLVADLVTDRPPAFDPAALAPGRPPGPPADDSVDAMLARVAAD